ncbi:hypothetical protein JCM1841_002223 [Sporobolomyces salmonicolor]
MQPEFDLNAFLASYNSFPSSQLSSYAPQQAPIPESSMSAWSTPSSTQQQKLEYTAPTSAESSIVCEPHRTDAVSSYASQIGADPQLTSAAGPSRTVTGGATAAGKGAAGSGSDGDAAASASRWTSSLTGTGPYARRDGEVLQVKQPKSSSTTALFNTRKNWSQHILESIEDFMQVLTPDGTFVFASPSVEGLCGYDPDELHGQSLFSFLHPSDVEPFKREFFAALRSSPSSPESLTCHYRLRTKDDRQVLFEVTGHPYFTAGDAQPKYFFAMARPYPSRAIAELDSFLELKMENERLRQELLVLYEEIEREGSSRGGSGVASFSDPTVNSTPAHPPPGEAFDARSPAALSSVIDPSTGLIRTSELIPSTSNTYGALGIGISANGKKGDGQGDKRRRKQNGLHDSDLVCRDCGRTDSPEWRKGPDGPKTLCNACGLRYAKLKSRMDKPVGGPSSLKKVKA